MLSAYLGITNNEWFNFLAQRHIADEVNFWIPSAPQHKLVEPGSLWLLKLHSPLDVIAGVGVFMHYSVLPLQMAWDAFGINNGLPTIEAFRSAIMRHRNAKDDSWNISIGCAILDQVIYLPEALWVPYKTRSLVSGKHMNISDEQTVVNNVLQNCTIAAETHENHGFVYSKTYTPQFALREIRQGQGTFRIRVTDAYQRRCAVTGEHSLPTLEAAHIASWADTHENDVTNGILLRADIHKLYDAGYVAIDPDNYKFVVSPRLKEDYNNGKEYYQLHGSKILLPEDPSAWPSKDALRKHADVMR